MQHLLDFIQEHTLEQQLYLVVRDGSGDQELLWKRDDCANHWRLRPRGDEGAWELIPREQLIGVLESRGFDMTSVKRELNAMLAAQIAFADMVLRDADQHLGRDLVERFVRSHRSFIEELQAAIDQIAEPPRPSMVVVPGGGAQTTLRSGHLSIVR